MNPPTPPTCPSRTHPPLVSSCDPCVLIHKFQKGHASVQVEEPVVPPRILNTAGIGRTSLTGGGISSVCLDPGRRVWLGICDVPPAERVAWKQGRALLCVLRVVTPLIALE